MLTLDDIYQKIKDQYAKGKIFLYILESDYSFTIKLKKPTSNEFLHNYKLYSDFYRKLACDKDLKVAYTSFKHIKFGEQKIPSYIYFENENDFYKALKLNSTQITKHHNFINYINKLIKQYSCLEEYIKKNIVKLFNCHHLDKIIKVVNYISVHDVSHIYLRELCLDGIDTKFIEHNRTQISNLLDILKDDININITCKDINSFAKRYGFKSKPTLIKFRSLDTSNLFLNKLNIEQAIALDKNCFDKLQVDDFAKIKRAFIIENEISFLSFPKIKDAIAIFGSGYAAITLADANFLHNLELFYFGDLDTDGFAIANALAQKFNNCKFQTILMNEQVLAKFYQNAVVDTNFKNINLMYLDAQAQTCFKALQEHKYGQKLRLEQEFIPFDYIKANLKQQFADCYLDN